MIWFISTNCPQYRQRIQRSRHVAAIGRYIITAPGPSATTDAAARHWAGSSIWQQFCISAIATHTTASRGDPTPGWSSTVWITLSSVPKRDPSAANAVCHIWSSDTGPRSGGLSIPTDHAVFKYVLRIIFLLFIAHQHILRLRLNYLLVGVSFELWFWIVFSDITWLI